MFGNQAGAGGAPPSPFAAFASAPLTAGFAREPVGASEAKPKTDASAPGPALQFPATTT